MATCSLLIRGWPWRSWPPHVDNKISRIWLWYNHHKTIENRLQFLYSPQKKLGGSESLALGEWRNRLVNRLTTWVDHSPTSAFVVPLEARHGTPRICRNSLVVSVASWRATPRKIIHFEWWDVPFFQPSSYWGFPHFRKPPYVVSAIILTGSMLNPNPGSFCLHCAFMLRIAWRCKIFSNRSPEYSCNCHYHNNKRMCVIAIYSLLKPCHRENVTFAGSNLCRHFYPCSPRLHHCTIIVIRILTLASNIITISTTVIKPWSKHGI